MPTGTSRQPTHLLAGLSKSNGLALEQLMPLVYDDLNRLARGYMRSQPSGHALQTAELIHEAYIKLAKQDDPSWESRMHFVGVAARAMQHILVDHARSNLSQKRGGWLADFPPKDNFASSTDTPRSIVALDDALEILAATDDRKSRVVHLKFFAGLTNDEIGKSLNISPATVKRDWRSARKWLLRHLSGVQNSEN